MVSEHFYTVALQLLGFRYFIDFEDTDSFLKEVQFPIEYGNLVENLYHLLNTRTVKRKFTHRSVGQRWLDS